jgi:5-methylcytosine-specific restriction endonuclease McrBC regulatory subunit McrC
MTPDRTLLLTERKTTRCRLPPAVVDFLLARHARHLAIVPTARRHTYRVTPAGRVGRIDAPGCRLIIQPKIPLRNLFFLLDPAAELPEQTGQDPTPEQAVLDWLAAKLLGLLHEHLALGLQRGYAEQAVQGQYLQGRLDVAAQLREQRPGQLHCVHDQFTADLPCNQALRAAGEALADCWLVGEGLRSGLRRALSGFPEVTSLPLTPDLVERAQRERVPAGYEPLLDLCGLLAGSITAGTTPAFLLDLERIFEAYVTRVTQAALAEVEGVTVEVQQTTRRESPTGPPLSLRPDIHILRSTHSAMVLDAKWKRLPADAVLPEDVYQVTAYCTALGAPCGVLVYPGRRERVQDYALGAVRLSIRTLDVAGSLSRCRRAQRRLGRWLRSTLASPC